MIFLDNNDWYKDNEELYNFLSDYIYDQQILIMDTNPYVEITPTLSDCWLNQDGDLFLPLAYRWTYKGSNEFDDPDEYTPIYLKEPTLTKEEIDKMIKQNEN